MRVSRAAHRRSEPRQCPVTRSAVGVRELVVCWRRRRFTVGEVMTLDLLL